MVDVSPDSSENIYRTEPGLNSNKRSSPFSFIFELYCVPRERLHDRCGTGSHSEAIKSNPIEFGVEA